MSDFHKNKGDTSVVRLHFTTRVKTIFLVSNFVIFPQNLKYWNEPFWKVACDFHKNKGDTVVYICIPPLALKLFRETLRFTLFNRPQSINQSVSWNFTFHSVDSTSINQLRYTGNYYRAFSYK